MQKLFDDKGKTFLPKGPINVLHGNKTLENMACIMVPITKIKSLDFRELLMHVNDNSFMMASRELVPMLVTPKSYGS